MTDWHRIHRLQCGVQHYAWGSRIRGGSAPYIAELLGETPQPHQPYAELWIGAHPDLPSVILSDDGEMPLDAAVRGYPEEILGARVLRQGFRSFPFLLKVLSCERALSIQAHPDRMLAQRLHAAAPRNYPDDNHKPEIAIAVTAFEALCQFRPTSCIRADLRRLGPLAPLAEAAAGRAAADWLRAAYAQVFAVPEPMAVAMLDALAHEVTHADRRTAEDECFLHLNAAFPGDRGALSAYFLNRLRLQPGEAIFLAAGEPHAYLHGTIVECMANSNNVVRGGLTSKLVDVEVLLAMLTYRTGPPEIMSGTPESGHTTRYVPPVPEFQVAVTHGPSVTRPCDARTAGPALVLVLDGSATFDTPGNGETIRAGRGTAWLLPAALGHVAIRLACSNDRVVVAMPNVDAVGEKPEGPQQ